MTKQEIAKIIADKAAEYGFEIEENSVGWNNKRNDQSYINIEICPNINYDKTDWENHKIFTDIEVSASVRRMGGNPTPEELLRAAKEIERAARLTAELQLMNLSYEEIR